MQKEKILEKLDDRLQKYRIVEEFLEEIKKKFGRKEKEKIWENLDEGLWEFLEDMRKQCGKKERKKSYRVEEDIWGEIDNFHNRYSIENREEEVR